MLVDQLRAAAAPDGLAVRVLTFHPHPLTLLRPELAPRALDTLEGRKHWLQTIGVDHVDVLAFNDELRSQSPEWFVEEVLFNRLGARVVIASDDSRFGHRGAGDITLLRACAARHDVRVLRCPAVSRGGDRVSSSRIRRLVAGGEIDAANQLLSRPYALHGEVVHGDARGRTIGFPTANLSVGPQVRPAAGVYAGRLEVDGQRLDAVCNLGVRPTVNGVDYRVEAHVLDWSGDLYGKAVTLHLHARIRGEQRFSDISALSAQIALDCTAARTRLIAP